MLLRKIDELENRIVLLEDTIRIQQQQNPQDKNNNYQDS